MCQCTPCSSIRIRIRIGIVIVIKIRITKPTTIFIALVTTFCTRIVETTLHLPLPAFMEHIQLILFTINS